jgi:hypothetical protein
VETYDAFVIYRSKCEFDGRHAYTFRSVVDKFLYYSGAASVPERLPMKRHPHRGIIVAGHPTSLG